MACETIVIETHLPEETERVGNAVAGLLLPKTVVALRGDLASGKTCFVRGMASHFGAAGLVSSPTFTLVNHYGDAPRLYHVDLYRLNSLVELADLGYEDLFDPDGICVIEWAERAGELLPSRRVEIQFEHLDETSRRISISDVSDRSDAANLPAGWPQSVLQGLSAARQS